ncbi:PAAR domain-containing protein [Paraburkholderia sp. J11-2]|uniref:PAAR domain-containing protein n=1 Tax=Paraburkholderia sp. J11-2 TaxID=2805431 RepID=UPI002AB6F0C6|nr:PAAR domain-containing protein [Paraburkholderia sp. J11-2]
MRRALLKLGDKTTAGGVVLEGVDSCLHHGTPLTFIGAKIWCPECNSEGVIGWNGPHRKATMMGKQQALEGDLCLCRCDPPPVLLASQNSAWHVFESDELERATGAGHSMTRASPAGHDELEHYFEIVDAVSGAPIEGMTYTLLSNGVSLVNSQSLVTGRTAIVSKADYPNLTFIAWRKGDVR